MKKINRIIQIVWLAVAAVCVVEAYIEQSSKGFTTQFYILVGAFVVAIAMYTLRRRQGKSMK